MFRFHSPRLWKMRPCRRKSLYSRPRKHSAAAGCDRRLEYTHLIASGDLNSSPWQRRGDGEAVKKLESSAIPLLASLPCYVPHLLLDTGALKTTGGKAEVPSLHKEGWLRPLRKCRGASLAGADGVVGSSHR